MDHLYNSTEEISMDNSSRSDLIYDSLSYDHVYVYPYNKVWLSTVPLICSLIIAVTIAGNLMVIGAYIRDHRIRAKVSNLFILNLAITDLTVGTCMWPISLSWLIRDTWIHGEIFCKIWLILDYTMTMMSALTLVMISWDRYCLLAKGMRYRTFQTKKRIRLILLVTWTTVITWYTVLEFAWTPITGQSNIDYTYDCEMEFTASPAITILANTLEFFIPFTILIVLNAAVYRKIRQRSRGIIRPSPLSDPSSRSDRSLDGAPKTLCLGASLSSAKAPDNDQGGVPQSSRSAGEIFGLSVPETSGNLRGSRDEVAVDPKAKAEGLSFARHRKAALVLGLLVGFFLVCWVPIQITSAMYAFCGYDCVSYISWEITNCLVWANSMINPFIYAATNKYYRQNFRHFLLLDRCCCCIRKQ